MNKNQQFCNTCYENKEIEQFITNDKHYKTCSSCRARVLNRSKSIKQKNENIDPNYRVCSKCGEKKDIIEFKNKRKTKTHNNCSKCREYGAKLKAKSRNKDPEKHKKYIKHYNEQNKEKIKIKDRKNYINNIEYMIYNSAKQHSKLYNTEFNLTEDYIKSIFPKDNICVITNKKFIISSGHVNNYSPTIDKINPELGYVIGNIQIISYIANKIKYDATLSELEFILNGYNNLSPPIPHAIDNETRKIIIEDRLSYIREDINCNTNRKSRIINIERHLVKSANKRSKIKNMDFDIDEDYIKSIWQVDNSCPITKLKYTAGTPGKYSKSASIDRIDSTKGYVRGNVQIISARANIIRNNLSIQEFGNIVKLFREYYDRTGTGIIL